MSIETEIKIKLEDPEKIRQKILLLGAKGLVKNGEFDIYFDTEIEGSRKGIFVKRLRLQGDKATLCYKGPRKIDGITKERLEIEDFVQDFEKMREILRAWGHKEGEKTEKIRETFEYKDCKILIDKLPFLGFWLEIEGEKEKILEIAKGLELDLAKTEKRHYGEIFVDFCKETNCPFINEMTFEKEKLWLDKKI